MNTIKVYLQSSGEFADLQKDFPLYQGQYNDKLLNVFVPTAILAPKFTDGGQGTAVKIGTIAVGRNGTLKTSVSYYMRYLKMLTYKGVEYALYERKLPKEFTYYAGQGENAPTMVINVVNIDTEANNVISLITTQTAKLDVLESSTLDTDTPIEAGTAEQIFGQLAQITASLEEKQDKIDSTLALPKELPAEDRSVVGAINEVSDKVDSVETSVNNNSSDIAKLQEDFSKFQQNISTGENYIGTLTVMNLPDDTQLNGEVQARLSRLPKAGDMFIVVQELANETDRNFKYIYNAEEGTWGHYEIPPMEKAENGTYGILQGTYGVADYSLLVNITDGEIKDIYIKKGNAYVKLSEELPSISSKVESILSGTVGVGLASRAISDKNGAQIDTTYQTKEVGASKQYVKDYALPKEFNDALYLSKDGYKSTIPTTPDGIQFEKTLAVGYTEIFSCTYTLGDLKFSLASKNRYTNKIFLSVTQNGYYQFRLTTVAQKAGQAERVLNIEVTEPKLFNQDIGAVEFGGNMTELDGIIDLSSGDTITQRLEVFSTTSGATVSVISNETYPSVLYLYTGSQTIVLSSALRGEIETIVCTSATQEGNVYVSLPDGVNLVENCRYRFILPELPFEDLPVYFAMGDIHIPLKTIFADEPTISDLKQAKVEAGGYDFYGLVTDETVHVDLENLTTFASKELVEAHIGRETHLGFTATVSGTSVVGTLDSSISDFALANSTSYIFNVHLAETAELPDTYTFELRDKDGNTINVNCIFEDDITKTATIGHLRQIEQYSVGGYVWEFQGYYSQIGDTRVVYTDSVTRIKTLVIETVDTLPTASRLTPDILCYNGEIYMKCSENKNLIAFTIAGTSYQAEEGMTWEQWVNSTYNKDGYVIYSNLVHKATDSTSTSKGVLHTNSLFVYSSETITSGYSYRYGYGE